MGWRVKMFRFKEVEVQALIVSLLMLNNSRNWSISTEQEVAGAGFEP